MHSRPIQIYVGCALTNAPQTFRDFVAMFKRTLSEHLDVHVLEFLGLTGGTSTDVYHMDIGNVDKCDVFIAIVDEPSLGLGMEIMRAIMQGKQILCLHHKDTTITRLLLGAGELALCTVLQYHDADSAVTVAKDFLHDR